MRKTWLLFSQAVTVAVAVMFVVSTLKPEWLPQRGVARSTATAPSAEPVIAPPAPAVQPMSLVGGIVASSYSAAAKRASPAVVSITASRAPARSPRTDDPMFRFFFGDRGRQLQEERQVGLGSGVIVSTSGYLITNNHVIEGADDIEVALSDGRSAKARVIGTDPDSDVAVLKIELDRLPAVAFGNVDTAQVGDIVLAIGNPFGVGQTVTSGIVSALGRNQLGINQFENFIQTDAAINFGNSGGALVDAGGKLVGLNSAIAGRQAGIEGIGFAIPVDLVRGVVDAILKDGRVMRGWIGVVPSDISPEAIEQSGLPEGSVLVRLVSRNGPADLQGIVPGDVITQVNGKPLRGAQDLLANVAMLQPGQPVRLRLWRRSPAEPEGLEHNVRLEVIERPQQAGAMRSS